MKLRIRIILSNFIALLSVAVTIGAIIAILNAYNKPSTLSSNAINDIYAEAVKSLTEAANLTVNVHMNETILLSGNKFSSSIQQSIAYCNLHTNESIISVNEIHHMGQHSICVNKLHKQDQTYYTINNQSYITTQNLQSFLSDVAPPKILDISLYNQLEGVDTGPGYILVFRQPSTPETWTKCSEQNFVDAWGCILISKDGQPIKTAYYLATSKDDTLYYKSYRTEFTCSATPFAVALLDEYTHVENFNDVFAIERACGFIQQAVNISSQKSERVYFHAFGDTQTQTVSICASQNKESWTATIKTEQTTTNASRPGENSTTEKIENYSNNIYSAYQNGISTTVDPQISETSVKTYCHNILLSSLVLLDYVTETTTTTGHNTLLITMQLDPAYSSVLCSAICQNLYHDPNLLNTYIAAETDSLEAYLKIDTRTGLPVASGIYYCGVFIIDGTPYPLRYQTDQSYDLS